jgi:hypothetical protein
MAISSDEESAEFSEQEEEDSVGDEEEQEAAEELDIELVAPIETKRTKRTRKSEPKEEPEEDEDIIKRIQELIEWELSHLPKYEKSQKQTSKEEIHCILSGCIKVFRTFPSLKYHFTHHKHSVQDLYSTKYEKEIIHDKLKELTEMFNKLEEGVIIQVPVEYRAKYGLLAGSMLFQSTGAIAQPQSSIHQNIKTGFKRNGYLIGDSSSIPHKGMAVHDHVTNVSITPTASEFTPVNAM